MRRPAGRRCCALGEARAPPLAGTSLGHSPELQWAQDGGAPSRCFHTNCAAACGLTDLPLVARRLEEAAYPSCNDARPTLFATRESPGRPLCLRRLAGALLVSRHSGARFMHREASRADSRLSSRRSRGAAARRGWAMPLGMGLAAWLSAISLKVTHGQSEGVRNNAGGCDEHAPGARPRLTHGCPRARALQAPLAPGGRVIGQSSRRLRDPSRQWSNTGGCEGWRRHTSRC